MSQTLEAYLLAALLITLVLSIIVAFLVLWRRMPQKPPEMGNRKEKHGWWQAGVLAIIYLGFMSWIDTREQNIHADLEAQGQIRALMNAGYLRPDKAWFKANLNELCGPRTDGMTDQVVMVITTEADGQHKATGCSRIAERQYMVRPKAKQVQG